MFSDCDIKGSQLPTKTLCLTYDDGPGPHTAELGRYLFEQGIQAAFFVIGRHAEHQQATLRHLRNWGHLIGNHTYSHPGLVALAESGGDVVDELVRTDAIIRPFLSGGIALFRAPYGNWRQKLHLDSSEDKPVSLVAEILNRCAALWHYIGPVNWDISAEDWDFWTQGLPAERCVQRYLEIISRKQRGIVLMHDSSEDEAVRAKNGALQATQLLVPALRQQGYRFVGLNSIPQICKARSVLTSRAAL
ncbi:MAG TPA: polysaccharide deacetylase family protein [Gemmataceae bacterium]|nr:polysaccharide deacetylase family protein [Gemmataceae bacterium]